MDTYVRRTCEDTGRGGHLQAKDRGLTRNQPCGCLDLTLLVSRTVRKEMWCYLSPQVCGAL